MADKTEVVDAVVCKRHSPVSHRFPQPIGRRGGERPQNVQFPLNDDGARADDFLLRVADDEDVVLVPPPGQPVVTFVPRFLADVADGGEDAEDVQHAGFVVGALQGPDGVVFREGGGDVGGDEGGGEEGTGGRGGGGEVWGVGVEGGGGPHCGWVWFEIL